MCNALWDLVGCLKILFWISEQRQAEGEFREFVFVCVFLSTSRKFTEEHKTFWEHLRLSLNNVIFHLPTLIHNCTLKLVNKIIPYYDARSKIHQITIYFIKKELDATLVVLFISHCKITLHVSNVFCVHHQEY